ncbi:hypothetical protein ACK8P5_26455 (plasmid) [Paenibacillus sp. EC2-1]|uniref:hypothetical protein n=1 Tax=Paenibacillus sp. EC2-1 TaxID=3388665 RepID=UPI003BEEB3AB
MIIPAYIEVKGSLTKDVRNDIASQLEALARHFREKDAYIGTVGIKSASSAVKIRFSQAKEEETISV